MEWSILYLRVNDIVDRICSEQESKHTLVGENFWWQFVLSLIESQNDIGVNGAWIVSILKSAILFEEVKMWFGDFCDIG